MSSYAKIYPEFIDGETGRRIVEEGGANAKLIAYHILSCRQAIESGAFGLYKLPLVLVAYDNGMKEAQALEALAACERAEFAFYDAKAQVVFVPNMGLYQYGATLSAADNRHHHLTRRLHSMRRMPFFDRWYEMYRDRFNLPDLDEIGDGPPADPKKAREKKAPKTKQPGLPGVETADEAVAEESGDDIPNVTPAVFAAGWNEVCVPLGFPAVRMPLSPDRQRHVFARLREHPDPRWWGNVFQRMGRSSFLLGKTPRSNWKADFDWVVKPGSADRVLEGKYDDHNPQQNPWEERPE